MFPTSSRSRMHRETINAAKAYQHESPPPKKEDGVDSCYGVQSVSSWGEQSEDSLEIPIPSSSSAINTNIEDEYQPEDIEDDNDVIVDDQVEQEEEQESEEGESTPEGYDSLSSSNIGLGLGLGITSPPEDDTWPSVFDTKLRNDSIPNKSQPISPSRPIHTKSEQRIVPPSPEDTVHPLDRAPSSHRNGRPHQTSPRQHRQRGDADMMDSEEAELSISSTVGKGSKLTLEDISKSFDSPYLPTSGTSEPSSPASFTSMPYSYVASLSSLSRTSSISPMGLAEYQQHHNHCHNQHHVELIQNELVLPTLSLPSESLSLHMSLSKWSGDSQESEEGGLGIILLGGREQVEKTLREVRDIEQLVEIKSGVGIVRNGKIALRIITGLKTVEQAQSRILYTYNSLNVLLHPDLREDSSAQGELRRLIEGYIGRSDWVHSVIALEQDTGLEALEELVPLHPVDAKMPTTSEHSESSSHIIQTPSIRPSEIEPTPRPSAETSGYFAPRSYTPSPSSSRDASPVRPSKSVAVQQIVELLDHLAVSMGKSIDSFLSWRSKQIYYQPQTSTLFSTSPFDHMTKNGEKTMTSSLTSASSGVGAMPTVARAQGGGEWEATLSRRVAQRRESDTLRDRSLTSLRGSKTSTSSGYGHRPRKRKSLDKLENSSQREFSKKDCFSPLFPKHNKLNNYKSNKSASASSINEKGLGMNELMEKTFFKSVRKWTKGWRGLLVVGLVVAVGWGCWISKKGF
ncbi:uncharacterized protein L201_005759 [Kwoniella dendrophila CBS 6074]|uniref:Uncharacterized protein n=1 Tax=Kwoniella dendrophila CBS 6074 TaxID=1295534 RepID=A0AAX4K1Q0_9TREE